MPVKHQDPTKRSSGVIGLRSQPQTLSNMPQIILKLEGSRGCAQKAVIYGQVGLANEHMYIVPVH